MSQIQNFLMDNGMVEGAWAEIHHLWRKNDLRDYEVEFELEIGKSITAARGVGGLVLSTSLYFSFSILVSSAICLSQWMSACVLLGNWEIYHDGVTDLGWQGEDDFCHATSYFTTKLWNILPLVNNFVMLFINLTFAITKKTDNFLINTKQIV